ncbi:MAG: S8 family serine peptidase [Candidatus Eisenbacteria bacterium]|nr:S8 family serine peptidase [Candidatus Eisenbacteria bacterium]
MTPLRLRPAATFILAAGIALCGLFAAGAPSRAKGLGPVGSPWVWDDDGNGIDDRFAAVDTGGLAAAYTANDPTHGRLRFQVGVVGGLTTFGAYVRYTGHPGAVDVAAVNATGARVTHTYRWFDCLRIAATYPQIAAVRALPGVWRVETIQALYPSLDVSARGARARDTDDGTLFPSVWKDLGLDGHGVVVAFLDTGINDTADVVNPGYPGHESLRGRCLGGGDFSLGDSTLDVPDVNPQDHGAGFHGTHVAGIALGTGGPAHVCQGMAPGARFVDCKVLTDAGVGFGVLDAVDWLITKRDTLWLGLAHPEWRGVQVMNLSLAGPDNSDGNDVDAQALNTAAQWGILSVVAMGNDHRAGFVPSPASADSAVAVAALNDRNTTRRDDDQVDTLYSNQGPRPDDADTDHRDELKPLVTAPGSGILSADGNPATDGTRYVQMNGTSMAAPHVAGALALMLQANPALRAARAMEILRFSSEHKGVPGDPFAGPGHPDPGWSRAWGHGELDAYAAVLEAASPGQTQLVQLRALPRGGCHSILLRWFTQREVGVAGFHVYRSTDSASAFVRRNAVMLPSVGVPAAPGDSVHLLSDNRTGYAWNDTGVVAGATWFYRLAWVDALGGEHLSPVLRARMPAADPVATLRIRYTHDFADQDLSVRYGTGGNPAAPDWWRALGGTGDADSMITRPGISYLGTRSWIFHQDILPSDGAAAFLPPGSTHPWFLGVTEGGFLNTSGTVDEFAITWHDAYSSGRDSTFRSASPPQRTVEGLTSILWIPLPVPVDATPSAPGQTAILGLGPSPARREALLAFRLASGGEIRVTLHDVTGREVRRLFGGLLPAGLHRVRLDASEPGTARLAAGIYWVRLGWEGGSSARRLVVVP